MGTTISKTGAPVIELGDWVITKNNPEFTALMEQHAAQMEANAIVPNPAFTAMVEQFFAETNQEGAE
jgi:adenylate kinase family enzyme